MVLESHVVLFLLVHLGLPAALDLSRLFRSCPDTRAAALSALSLALPKASSLTEREGERAVTQVRMSPDLGNSTNVLHPLLAQGGPDIPSMNVTMMQLGCPALPEHVDD